MSISAMILPSPLLPATAYEGLRAALVEMGVQAAIAPCHLGADGTAHDLIGRWAGLVATDTLLVPHSNAGYLAPSVRGLRRSHQPIVFMDAALPPETGATSLAPPPFRRFLTELADDAGRLPPWTRWWPRSELTAVIPADGFDTLDRACPRVPLHYFDAQLSAPDGWADTPNAYLAFGSTYGDELDSALRRGWPHALIEGGHLHFLHDPRGVAAEILRLATA